MLVTLSLEAIFEYCERHNVNMLLCEHCYLDDDAVFKLYKVREDLLMRFFTYSHHAEKRRMILPYELCRRKSKTIKIDTALVHNLWV